MEDGSIDYIKPLEPDALGAMSQPALDRYISEVDRTKAAVLVDSSLVTDIPEGITNLYPIPVTDIAERLEGDKDRAVGGEQGKSR